VKKTAWFIMLVGALLGAGCATALLLFTAHERSGTVATGQRFVVTVPSSVDQAYAWYFVHGDSDPVALRETWYEPGEPGQGLWYFSFTALRPGEYRLPFICRRTVEPQAAPLANHYFYLTVRP